MSRTKKVTKKDLTLPARKGKTTETLYETINNKLKLGELITYKEVCERLELPYYNSGNQKKAQVKDLQRYIEFETVDRKWLITDIYLSPLDKEARAVPSNSIYVKYVECILLKYLSEQEGNEAYITKNNLFLLLGMVNHNYNFYRDKHDKLQELDNMMTQFEVNNFYQRSHSYLSKIVDRSLSSLKRRCLIMCDESYMITEYNEGILRHREATTSEKEDILKIKRRVLLEFGYSSESQLVFEKVDKKISFYSALDKTFKEFYGWEGVYKAYHIIYNQENAAEALTTDQIELEKMAKLSINEKVIDKINTQAESIVQQKEDNMRNGLSIGTKINFKYPEVYVEVQKMLSERLLRINNQTS